MSLEDAQADVAAMTEEYGLTSVLCRHGLGNVDLARMLFWAHDDTYKATAMAHGVLIGLQLAEMREQEQIR